MMEEKWKFDENYIILKKPLIAGILNITPDSFYDGGKFIDFEKAIERGKEIIREGADIIDVGGESSRPGSEPVSEKEELERVIPVIEELVKENVIVSCDTYKSRVAEKAIESGAKIINDISAFRMDEKLIDIIKGSNCGYVLMHMKGTPKNMQKNPFYDDTIGEITSFFREKLELIEKTGIDLERVVIDPGIGFGKRLVDNLIILKKLDEFKKLGRPIFIGTSRKSFIGGVLNVEVDQRLEGSLATVVYAYIKGAKIFRVHDVKETKKVIDIIWAIENENNRT